MATVTGWTAAKLAAELLKKLDVTSAAELVRDTVGATLVAGTNVSLLIDDNANTITISSAGGGGGGTTGPSGYVDTYSDTYVGGLSSGGSGGASDHSELTGTSASNSHPISAITNLQTSLDSKADFIHTHGSGESLPSGPAIGATTKFLRGDRVWAVPPGGASGAGAYKGNWEPSVEYQTGDIVSKDSVHRVLTASQQSQPYGYAPVIESFKYKMVYGTPTVSVAPTGWASGLQANDLLLVFGYNYDAGSTNLPVPSGVTALDQATVLIGASAHTNYRAKILTGYRKVVNPGTEPTITLSAPSSEEGSTYWTVLLLRGVDYTKWANPSSGQWHGYDMTAGTQSTLSIQLAAVQSSTGVGTSSVVAGGMILNDVAADGLGFSYTKAAPAQNIQPALANKQNHGDGVPFNTSGFFNSASMAAVVTSGENRTQTPVTSSSLTFSLVAGGNVGPLFAASSWVAVPGVLTSEAPWNLGYPWVPTDWGFAYGDSVLDLDPVNYWTNGSAGNTHVLLDFNSPNAADISVFQLPTYSQASGEQIAFRIIPRKDVNKKPVVVKVDAEAVVNKTRWVPDPNHPSTAVFNRVLDGWRIDLERSSDLFPIRMVPAYGLGSAQDDVIPVYVEESAMRAAYVGGVTLAEALASVGALDPWGIGLTVRLQRKGVAVYLSDGVDNCYMHYGTQFLGQFWADSGVADIHGDNPNGNVVLHELSHGVDFLLAPSTPVTFNGVTHSLPEGARMTSHPGYISWWNAQSWPTGWHPAPSTYEWFAEWLARVFVNERAGFVDLSFGNLFPGGVFNATLHTQMWDFCNRMGILPVTPVIPSS